MAARLTRPACRVVISGSPRMNGRSARLVRDLSTKLDKQHKHDAVKTLWLPQLHINGCVGCDICRATGECFFRDDMRTVMGALETAHELYLVSPVYFSGPPAQLKSLLDRLQPHYWQCTRMRPKRKAFLHVVGEGGDPHGYDPLVTICRSALATAGFHLEDVVAHIEPQPRASKH